MTAMTGGCAIEVAPKAGFTVYGLCITIFNK